MYSEKHFTHDRAVVEFDTTVDGIDDADDGVTFDWDDIETVRIDNAPYAEAFDTKEFHKIPATVAKPIPQQYHYGEDAVTLKKPREELKKAAWSLDNAPWTHGHPNNGMVKDVDDVRGFWKDPRYVDSLDDLDADLYVPADDSESKHFIETTSDVSVGFYNRIARVDSYDGVVGGSDDDTDIDGYQTDMLFDHCASVKVGRCSGEDGCGIDSGMQHGTFTVVDSEHSYATGDWVQWDASGGPTYGKVDEVIEDGCTTRGKGDMEVCAEEDDPAVVLEVYDDESGESKDEMVRHKMSELDDWAGPSTDAQPPEFSEGMMVQWQANPDMVGKIVHVDDQRNVLMVEVMEEEDGEMVPSGFTLTAGYTDIRPMNRGMKMDSLDAEDVDLVPPEAAQENAQMALDAREETGNPNDCGTETGWTRAEQLASGEELTPDIVSKMSQFERHQSNSEMGEEGRKDCGWMMWKAWGGDEGVDWAGRKMDEMQSNDDSFKRDTGITNESEQVESGVDTDLSMQKTTDAPEGLYAADGMWFAVGPDEHPDDSTEWPDDAKFPVTNCGDVRDAWNLSGTGDISIEESTLEARIKRASDAHDCPPEFKPWMEETDSGPSAIADSAKRYSICGSRKEVMDVDTDCGCDTDNTDTTMEINFDDLSVEAAFARLEAQHDGAEERLSELREAEDAAEAADEAAEELDIEDVSELADAVSLREQRIEELEAKVDELQEPQMREDAQAIADTTDRYGEDAEAVIDHFDGDVEEIADKRELVEDLAAGYDDVTANSGSEPSEETDSTSTGKYAKTPW